MTTSQRSHPHQTLSAEQGREVFQREHGKKYPLKLRRPTSHSLIWISLTDFRWEISNMAPSQLSNQSRDVFSPPLRPRSGVCNSVCFHFPWYEASCRLELCVWRWGRFVEQGWCWKLGAGRRPFAGCLGVSTGRRKRRKSGVVFARSY